MRWSVLTNDYTHYSTPVVVVESGLQNWQPPETAPPEMAPPEMAPPEMAPPEMAPPEMAPPEMAPYQVALSSKRD